MSYITDPPDPPTNAVVKKCCRNTCCLHIKSDIGQILKEHKIEFSMAIFMLVWIITNTILLAIAANSEYNVQTKQIWLVFAGLTFCLPTTVVLLCLSIFLSMYLRQVWQSAQYETHNELLSELHGMSESLYDGRVVNLEQPALMESVIVRVYDDDTYDPTTRM